MSTPSFEEYQEKKREREWGDKVKKQKEGMGNAERVRKATEYKGIGNDKFKSGNNWEAREYYREAIIYVEDLVDARRKERVELLVPLYSNLAQVHLKLGENRDAEEVCSKALEIANVPRNNVAGALRAKALFRRGVARRALGMPLDAKEDLIAARKLQPENEDVARELAEVVRELAAAPQVAAVASGFLNAGAEVRQQREAKRKQQAEAKRVAEDKRKARRARAEERQQMKGAFDKLAKGKMLYEAREQEMVPVREKEREKEKTLELERDLLNIIDDSKGLPKTSGMEDFMKKKEVQAIEQNGELNQKKKVLDKLKKEERWDVDDAWKGQRDEHRQQVEQRRLAGEVPSGVPSLWDSVEVGRWCEQRLRDKLLGTFVEGFELEPDVARKALQAAGRGSESAGTGYVLKALVTDVLKLVGDAAVMRLNTHKPPLYYYDYFVKLDWEVAVDRQGNRSYRSADELINVAAKSPDSKAPPSVVEHLTLGGTFKIREFCSEDEREDGVWPWLTKVKKPCTQVPELAGPAEELCARLREKCTRLLQRWAEEYREHWKC